MVFFDSVTVEDVYVKYSLDISDKSIITVATYHGTFNLGVLFAVNIERDLLVIGVYNLPVTNMQPIVFNFKLVVYSHLNLCHIAIIVLFFIYLIIHLVIFKI